MDRKEYIKEFKRTHYERLTLSMPIGTKQIIKNLANEKGLSATAYILDLVRQDQEGMYDNMQLAERSKEKILAIKGNSHDGYDIHLKDGRTFHCRTKLEVRKLFSQTLAKDIEPFFDLVFLVSAFYRYPLYQLCGRLPI